MEDREAKLKAGANSFKKFKRRKRSVTSATQNGETRLSDSALALSTETVGTTDRDPDHKQDWENERPLSAEEEGELDALVQETKRTSIDEVRNIDTGLVANYRFPDGPSKIETEQPAGAGSSSLHVKTSDADDNQAEPSGSLYMLLNSDESKKATNNPAGDGETMNDRLDSENKDTVNGYLANLEEPAIQQPHNAEHQIAETQTIEGGVSSETEMMLHSTVQELQVSLDNMSSERDNFLVNLREERRKSQHSSTKIAEVEQALENETIRATEAENAARDLRSRLISQEEQISQVNDYRRVTDLLRRESMEARARNEELEMQLFELRNSSSVIAVQAEESVKQQALADSENKYRLVSEQLVSLQEKHESFKNEFALVLQANVDVQAQRDEALREATLIRDEMSMMLGLRETNSALVRQVSELSQQMTHKEENNVSTVQAGTLEMAWDEAQSRIKQQENELESQRNEIRILQQNIDTMLKAQTTEEEKWASNVEEARNAGMKEAESFFDKERMETEKVLKLREQAFSVAEAKIDGLNAMLAETEKRAEAQDQSMMNLQMEIATLSSKHAGELKIEGIPPTEPATVNSKFPETEQAEQNINVKELEKVVTELQAEADQARYVLSSVIDSQDNPKALALSELANLVLQEFEAMRKVSTELRERLQSESGTHDDPTASSSLQNTRFINSPHNQALEQDLWKANANLDAQQSINLQLEQEVAALRTELSQAWEVLSQFTFIPSNNRQSIDDGNESIDSIGSNTLAGQLALFIAELEATGDELGRLNARIRNNETFGGVNVLELSTALKNMRADASASQVRYADLQKSKEELDASATVAEPGFDSKLADANAIVEELRDEIERLQKNQEILRSDLEKARKEVLEATNLLAERESHILELDELGRVSRQVEIIVKESLGDGFEFKESGPNSLPLQVRSLVHEFENAKREMAQHRQNAEIVQDNVARLQREKDQLVSELDTLSKNLVDSNENLTRTVNEQIVRAEQENLTFTEVVTERDSLRLELDALQRVTDEIEVIVKESFGDGFDFKELGLDPLPQQVRLLVGEFESAKIAIAQHEQNAETVGNDVARLQKEKDRLASEVEKISNNLAASTAENENLTRTLEEHIARSEQEVLKFVDIVAERDSQRLELDALQRVAGEVEAIVKESLGDGFDFKELGPPLPQQVRSLVHEFESAKREMSQHRQQAEIFGVDVASLQGEKDRLASELDIMSSNLADAHATNEDLSRTVDEYVALKGSTEALYGEKEKIEEHRTAIMSEMRVIRTTLSALLHASHEADKEQTIPNLLLAVSTRFKDMNDTIESLKAQIKVAESKVLESGDNQNVWAAKLDVLQTELSAKTQENAKKVRDLEELQLVLLQEREAFKKQSTETNTELDVAETEIKSLNSVCDRLKERETFLEAEIGKVKLLLTEVLGSEEGIDSKTLVELASSVAHEVEGLKSALQMEREKFLAGVAAVNTKHQELSTDLREQLLSSSTSCDELNRLLDETRLALARNEDERKVEVSDLRKKLETLLDELEYTKKEKVRMEESVVTLRTEIAETRTILVANATTIASLTEEGRLRAVQFEDSRRSVERFELQLNDLTSELAKKHDDNRKLAESLEAAKSEQTDYEAERLNLMAKIEDLATAGQNGQDIKWKEQLEEERRQSDMIRTERDEVIVLLEQFEEELVRIRSNASSLQDEHDLLIKDLRVERSQKATLELSLAEERSKVGKLETAAARMEKYPKSALLEKEACDLKKTVEEQNATILRYKGQLETLSADQSVLTETLCNLSEQCSSLKKDRLRLISEKKGMVEFVREHYTDTRQRLRELVEV